MCGKVFGPVSTSALIEIGTEELPVTNLHIFSRQGPELFKKILTQYRLSFDQIKLDATPRRLAIFIENLGAKQKEERIVMTGPSFEKAYDAAGQPTQALLGFLKAQNASPKDVKAHETPKGKYAAVEKVDKGVSTVKIFPTLIKEFLTSLSFPKMMYWEDSGFRFPRPIRWLVALYGKKIVALSLAGVKSGRQSLGHRFLGKTHFSISQAHWSEYEKKLKAKHVILSAEKRKEMIAEGLKKKYRQKDFDSDLLHEAANLVEEPFLIQGKFSVNYRDLPEEVLATCMKKYQKIFACRDEKGGLVNKFVAVLNGRRTGLGLIIKDYENVLESRLRDAQYFYEEDTKELLEKRVSRLKELVFLGRLGTMQDKTERLQSLARDFAKLLNRPEIEKTLERAAYLSKADLVTHMVGEFPELQGIMGREYAEVAKEDGAVCRAIGEQYLPKNLAEDYKALSKKLSPEGALFGIVDRMDLLTGAFGVKMDPTGSEDPYALRRAGGVLIKLIRSFSFAFPVSELMKKSYEKYKVKLDLSYEEVQKKLGDFLKDRVAFELQLKHGTRPHEILQGVMKSTFENLADVFQRFEILADLSATDPKIFFKTSKVVERTSNILKGAKEAIPQIDPALFQENLEKKLYEILRQEESKLKQSVEKKDYEKVTRLYGETFYDPLHDFFNGVMVNVEDAPVRRNRQALMKQINVLYTDKVADLSVLTQVRESN